MFSNYSDKYYRKKNNDNTYIGRLGLTSFVASLCNTQKYKRIATTSLNVCDYTGTQSIYLLLIELGTPTRMEQQINYINVTQLV